MKARFSGGPVVMKRRILFLAILTVFCCSILSSISIRDTDTALSSALDGTIAAVASVVSDPPIPLQGVSFEYSDSGIPWRLIFTRSDISTFLESLSFSGENRRSWYETLLDQDKSAFIPCRARAIAYLESSAYTRDDVILDGTITLDLGEAENLALLECSSSWNGLDMPLSISLIVSGSRLEQSVIIEGEIEIIGGTDSKITVYSENLMLNGENISFSPFEISY